MSLEYVQMIIPFVVPLLVAFGKKLIPSIPKLFLPAAAIALGAAADAIAAYLGYVTAVSPVLGAILGAAGVGVRELYDQAKKLLVPA